MNNKITYHREGDYFIPDLYLPKQPKGHIGKYGHLRLDYLKNFNKGYYIELMINGTLTEHLLDVDKAATRRVKTIIKQLADSENVDENLKQTNQMEWVQAMSNIKNRAEKIVLNEIIYV